MVATSTPASGKKRLRIAICRVNQETHALSPVRTEISDFQRTHFLEGDEILVATKRSEHEVRDLFRNVELSGFMRGLAGNAFAAVEVVPLFSAWAAPSGPLSAACLTELKDRLEDGLQQAGSIDGLYLSLHGAMGAEISTDAEGEIIRLARETVGPEVKIAVSYDLHGNLTRQKVENADLSVAYKTNPHRDHARIGSQCARLLVDACLGKTRPYTAWRSLPMILGGGVTVDFLPPMRKIFKRLRQIEREEGILSTSLLMCHPWNADPELGWGVLVISDGDVERAEAYAEEIADMAWSVKDQMPPQFSSPQEAIAQARSARVRRKIGTITLSDVSDVVTAGSTGENTKLLEALIEGAQGLETYVPIRDAEVVESLWQCQIGDEVEVALGGKYDPERNPSLSVKGVLAHKDRAHGVDRLVVLRVGTIQIVIIEGPAIVMRPSFFRNAGLNPWKADVLVVKNFFPFRLFFLALSRKTIYVTTGGITDMNAAFEIDFAGPVHPKDQVRDWREADRRRRAIQ